MLAALALAVSCSGEEGGSRVDDTWVGTITTEGNVTTVVNESGSVWGGTARLVEEASIGVAVGPEEYMFGYISGVYATNDSIWVVDNQVPALRVYDWEGTYLWDVGDEGEGPGEFISPFWLAGTPDGRIYVRAPRNQRVNVYSLRGETSGAIPSGISSCCEYPMVVTPEGVPYVPARRLDPDTMKVVFGMQALGADGPQGPVIEPPGAGYEPEYVHAGERRTSVRFSPQLVWVAASWGAVIGGISDNYHFEIRRFDGGTTVVERQYEPVVVQEGEREWWRRYTVASVRRSVPEWSWNGAEIPINKPAFNTLIPTAGGGIWVIREGLGQEQPNCVEEPTAADFDAIDGRHCWRGVTMIDAFDAEGRFLGSVDTSQERLWLAPQAVHIRDNTVVAVAFDDEDTFMVKRYRLVLPGEEN